ncbi:hypothetical protein HMPREF9466_00052 [Fusobacterium necrophorum subsp. funduliforme 1_1_36S]|nr:hypothetical protein HMPREF9466_00052 [Fusobacterium necrophorum subsp. funduliforme 1_1_36S]
MIQSSFSFDLFTRKGADMKVDLHIHSTASDGSFSPKQVVQLAMMKK